MAAIQPQWTEDQQLHASAALAAGASQRDDIDLADLGFDLLAVTIEITFGGTPDGPVTVKVYASTNSGTDDDTEPLVQQLVEEEASATKRVTLFVGDVPYAAIEVTNGDSTANVTYASRYAARQWLIA